MADFTITITNSVGVYGPSAANRWGDYNWNAFTWAEGSPVDLVVAIGKVVANTLSITTTIVKDITHYLADSLTLSDSIANSPVKYIDGGSFALTADMGSEELRDTAGYSYVFPDRTTEAEDRAFPSWASGAAGSPTWTASAATAASWS